MSATRFYSPTIFSPLMALLTIFVANKWPGMRYDDGMTMDVFSTFVSSPIETEKWPILHMNFVSWNHDFGHQVNSDVRLDDT